MRNKNSLYSQGSVSSGCRLLFGETWQDTMVSPHGVLDRCSCNRMLSMVQAGLRSAGKADWLGCPEKVLLIGDRYASGSTMITARVRGKESLIQQLFQARAAGLKEL